MLEHRRLTKWKIVFPKKKKSVQSTKVHIVYKCSPLRRFSLELRGSNLARFSGTDSISFGIEQRVPQRDKTPQGPERGSGWSRPLPPPFLSHACAFEVSEHGPALPPLLPPRPLGPSIFVLLRSSGRGRGGRGERAGARAGERRTSQSVSSDRKRSEIWRRKAHQSPVLIANELL